MTTPDPPFRLATPADAKELADLVNFAGEGLPLYLWQGLVEDGGDPWELGRSRQAAKAREGQIIVADLGAGAIASLTGYAIGSEPVTITDDVPALFHPLLELENLVPDSWYVNVLACYPAHRGQGFGGRLLDFAEQIARDAGLTQMSVIVADTNSGARRLYARHGYRELASRPCIREGWDTDMSDWIVMTKALGETG